MRCAAPLSKRKLLRSADVKCSNLLAILGSRFYCDRLADRPACPSARWAADRGSLPDHSRITGSRSMA